MEKEPLVKKDSKTKDAKDGAPQETKEKSALTNLVIKKGVYLIHVLVEQVIQLSMVNEK